MNEDAHPVLLACPTCGSQLALLDACIPFGPGSYVLRCDRCYSRVMEEYDFRQSMRDTKAAEAAKAKEEQRQ